MALPCQCYEALGSDGTPVKIDKLIKKLKRELAASPQKAGALVLLVVVAGYFWGPLVMKWSGKGKMNPAAAAPATATAGPVDAPAAAAPAPVPTTLMLGWQQLHDLLEKDPQARPANLDPQWNDPFAVVITPVVEVVETTPEVESVSTTPDEITTPPEYVMTLTSVLVGRRSKTATINGKNYHEGDLLEALVVGGEEPVRLRLTRISASGVELVPEQGGVAVELPIRPRPLAAGEQIRANTISVSPKTLP